MKKQCLMLAALCLLVLPSVAPAATLTGNVVDNISGKPLQVGLLLYVKTPSGTWDLQDDAFSGASGSYSFLNVPAGTYYIECDAYVECVPEANYDYCADKYLPQYYNNIPLSDFQNKTQILVGTANLKLAPIRLHFRPFYFATVPAGALARTGNEKIKITGKLINTTKGTATMALWGIMAVPDRTDMSDYYGLGANIPFGYELDFRVKPGTNSITFAYELPVMAPDGDYEFSIYGAGWDGLPMLPELYGSVEYSMPARAEAVSSKVNAAKKHVNRRATEMIPTEVSADGQILQKGPWPSLK
ncbi:MAG: carboxypeptidase-like regulatory domain-containing protein [Syntrophobacteraceae bacterium]|jgi:hypothetical protein